MTQNRKRSRSFQDETDFMPLSKRINNLHINKLTSAEQQIPIPPEWNNQQQQQQMNNLQNNIPTPPSGVQSAEQNGEWNYNVPIITQYSPDMDETQNPHYFNINKLLYQMYMERMGRGGGHQI